MATSTLSSKGQITLPREVRERLNLSQGDRVTFSVQPSGDVVLRRVADAGGEELAGLLQHLRKRRTVSVADMNKAIRGRARLKHQQSRPVTRGR